MAREGQAATLKPAREGVVDSMHQYDALEDLSTGQSHACGNRLYP